MKVALLLAAVILVPMGVAIAEAPPVVPPESLWTPPVVTALVAAVFAGLALLLTTAGGIYIQGRTLGRQLGQQLKDTKDLSKQAVDLSETAVVQLKEVGGQLDGQRTELMERIAALEKMLSSVSGNTIRAEDAQRAADEHRHASVAAAAKRDAVIPPEAQ